MPYTLVGKCVHKENPDGSPGEKVKCHPNRAKALAHLQALQANVEEAKMTDNTNDQDGNDKMFHRPTQEQASYVTLSPDMPERACANCMWYISQGEYGAQCHIIDNYPEDILATGLCQRWEQSTETEPKPLVIEAENVEIMTGEMENAPETKADESAEPVSLSPFTRLKNTLSKIIPTPQPAFDPDMGSGFKVYDYNDTPYWVAWWSNDFKDRENEIISRAAHDRYLARVDKGLVPMPELWYWHIKGTVHGRAKWLARIDHMMVAVGTFDDSPRAQKFVQHYRKSKERYGVSHGFNYPKWALQNSVYLDYNTFEISPLPRKAAANLYTGFDEVKTMTITDAKRAALAKIVGEDGVNDILNDTEAVSKMLEELGLTFKDFSDIPGAQEAAKSDQTENVLGKLLLSLVSATGDLVAKQEATGKQLSELLTAHKSQVEALETKNAGLARQVSDLQKEQELAPRASQHEATITDDEQLKKDMEGKVADYDPFFGELQVPKGERS